MDRGGFAKALESVHLLARRVFTFKHYGTGLTSTWPFSRRPDYTAFFVYVLGEKENGFDLNPASAFVRYALVCLTINSCLFFHGLTTLDTIKPRKFIASMVKNISNEALLIVYSSN
jgi:hypothetical protein